MTIAFHGVNDYSAQLQQAKIGEKIPVKGVVFDTFDIYTPSKKPELKPRDMVLGVTPKISMARILFHRLTPEQINGVNTSGNLPKNAKFKDDALGNPKLSWNIADFTAGTHKLPKGYELKNDILGFTHVVREGTKCWYLKENKNF